MWRVAAALAALFVAPGLVGAVVPANLYGPGLLTWTPPMPTGADASTVVSVPVGNTVQTMSALQAYNTGVQVQRNGGPSLDTYITSTGGNIPLAVQQYEQALNQVNYDYMAWYTALLGSVSAEQKSILYPIAYGNVTDKWLGCLVNDTCWTHGTIHTCTSPNEVQGFCDSDSQIPGRGPIISGMGSIASTCAVDMDCPATRQFCRTQIEYALVFWHGNNWTQAVVDQVYGSHTYIVYYKGCQSGPTMCASDSDCPQAHVCKQWLGYTPKMEAIFYSDCQLPAAHLDPGSPEECVSDWQCWHQPGTRCQRNPVLDCSLQTSTTCPQMCYNNTDNLAYYFAANDQCWDLSGLMTAGSSTPNLITGMEGNFFGIPCPQVPNIPIKSELGGVAGSTGGDAVKGMIIALDLLVNVLTGSAEAIVIGTAINKMVAAAVERAVEAGIERAALSELETMESGFNVINELMMVVQLGSLAGQLYNEYGPCASVNKQYGWPVPMIDPRFTAKPAPAWMCPQQVGAASAHTCSACMPAGFVVNVSDVTTVIQGASYTQACSVDTDCPANYTCGTNTAIGCGPNGNSNNPSCRYSMLDARPFRAWTHWWDEFGLSFSASCPAQTYTTGQCAPQATKYVTSVRDWPFQYNAWPEGPDQYATILGIDENCGGIPTFNPNGIPYSIGNFAQPANGNLAYRGSCQAIPASTMQNDLYSFEDNWLRAASLPAAIASTFKGYTGVDYVFGEAVNQVFGGFVTTNHLPVPVDWASLQTFADAYATANFFQNYTVGTYPYTVRAAELVPPNQVLFTDQLFYAFLFDHFFAANNTPMSVTQYTSTCGPNRTFVTCGAAPNTFNGCAYKQPEPWMCNYMGKATLTACGTSWTCTCDSQQLLTLRAPVAVPTPDGKGCQDNCEAAVCNGRGMCTYGIDTYPGYSTNLTLGDTPDSLQRGGPCQCNPGWLGAYCEWPDPGYGCCNSHGVFGAYDGACNSDPYSCAEFTVVDSVCPYGYTDEIFPSLCSDGSQPSTEFVCYGLNDNEASLLNPTKSCTCYPGFYGPDCAMTQDQCNLGVCMGHGVCEFDPMAYDIQCVCDAGWTTYPAYQQGVPYRWTLDPVHDIDAPNRQCQFSVPQAILNHTTSQLITTHAVLAALPCGPYGQPRVDPNNPLRFLYSDGMYGAIEVDSYGRYYDAYGYYPNGVCECNFGHGNAGYLALSSKYCIKQAATWTALAPSDPRINQAGRSQPCGQPYRGQVVNLNDGWGSQDCLCNNGFGNTDCSEVLCPVNVYGDPCSGPGALDFSQSPPAIVGRGYCDSSSGSCLCTAGYVGEACDIVYKTCNNKGQVRPAVEL